MGYLSWIDVRIQSFEQFYYRLYHAQIVTQKSFVIQCESW